MFKNNKASIISVTVINYDTYLEAYTIKYELQLKAGIIRRRTILYSRTTGLAEDQNNKDLVKRIKQEITLFEKGVKNKRHR